MTSRSSAPSRSRSNTSIRRTSKAAYDAADAQVRAARAALDKASLDLSWATITSPIDGVAGVAQIRVGNLVGRNEPTLLATVSQTDPMRVTFAMSEVDLIKHPESFDHLEKRDLA